MTTLLRVFSMAIVTAAAGCRDAPVTAGYAILATTTSVQSSGLLDVLLPEFRKDTGGDLRIFLAGSGRALDMLRHGDADLVISHAPDAEARMLETQPAWTYRKVMFNTFVVAGPADDPAGVRRSASVALAMKSIATRGARFVSRGDESGTHERERALWMLAGVSPDATRMLVSGAGMATTLRQAAEAEAYTLTDKPTFLRLASSIDLALLFEGDPALLNTYAVIVGHSATPGHAIAVAWKEWLIAGRGRALIANYRVDEQRAFDPWPANAPSDHPYTRPVIR